MMRSGATRPMRSRLSSSCRSLAASWAAGDRCCSEHPPHTPKWAHLGVVRSGDGASTSTRTASSNWRRLLNMRRRTRSPGRAPSTKTALPSIRATPRPSWARSTTSRLLNRAGSQLPAGLCESSSPPPGHAAANARRCSGARIAKHPAHPANLSCVFRRVQMTAQQFEAQIDQVGVQHIRFTVVANALEAAREVGVPNLRAVHAQLAWKTQQRGHIVQARPAAALESRQHVHQVDVPPVESAEIIAVPEAAVRLPGLPVARGGQAMQEASVVQNRQVESGAVPRHQFRRELVQTLEEALDEVLFG